jgi:hypothetical protein
MTTTTAQPITSTTTSKPAKTPPNAIAGKNRKIKLGTAIALDGTKSYDDDGNPLQYYWQVIEGPGNYILYNETSATPTFKPAEVGTYGISLKVFDGTYNSKESLVSITVENRSFDNGVKVWCPFFFLTNNDPEKINKLREFRNNVLLKTPMGKEYVKLFYKNAIELLTILINNQDIADQSKTVLEELLPKIELVAEGKSIIITPCLQSKIESILNQISIEASIELKNAIDKLKKDLGEEKLFDELGMEESVQH